MSVISDYPTVSVIIPVFNDLQALKKVIPAIFSQDYSLELVEIFIVDNGSAEPIEDYILSLESEQVHFIKETTYLGSPYSCRNRGIEQATGEIIILLDATCIPTEGWLNNGIKHLINHECDILGGDVQFYFSDNPDTAEVIDAATSVRMEWSINTRKCAYTANLFIKKKWFDIIGLFPEGIRSGGDVRWTKKATNSGASICYSKEAAILKSTRKKKQLLNKKWRTATFQTQKWIDLNANYIILRHVKAFLKLALIPPSPKRIQDVQKLKSDNDLQISFLSFRVWLLDYRLRITEGFGILVGGLKYLFRY